MDYKKEVINGDMTEMNAQQQEDVSGGLVEGGGVSCLNHKLGPRYKKKSLFGWNWYAFCSKCKCEVFVKEGPWSGSPNDPE